MYPHFLPAFIYQGIILSLFSFPCATMLRRYLSLPDWALCAGGCACVAMAGYFEFWVFLWSPTVGKILAWLLFLGAAVTVGRGRKSIVSYQEALLPLALALLIGVAYISLTYLFKTEPFFSLARDRFVERRPPDNGLPALFADRLWQGLNPRHLLGDWLSSDRPPLQTGWILLTRPMMSAIGVGRNNSLGSGGIWFQLLWVPSLWALFRALGAPIRKCTALIVAVGFSGIFIFYTVFTWPKFAAASLLLTAFLVCFDSAGKHRIIASNRLAFCGMGAALAMLAHGGIAFSLVGLVPLLIYGLYNRSLSGKSIFVLTAVFALTLLPWSLYQRFYEPPGDRLLKWHLAGVIPPSDEPFRAALIRAYKELGWHQAWQVRKINFATQFASEAPLFKQAATPGFLAANREEAIAFTGRSFDFWIILLPLWALAFFRTKGVPGRLYRAISAWWLSGWLAWVMLMFLPEQAIVHQGTLLTQLLGFSLLAWAAASIPYLFGIVSVIELISFLVTWVPASATTAAPMNLPAAIVSVLSGAILLWLWFRGIRRTPSI